MPKQLRSAERAQLGNFVADYPCCELKTFGRILRYPAASTAACTLTCDEGLYSNPDETREDRLARLRQQDQKG